MSHQLDPRAESELEPAGIFRGLFPLGALLYALVCFTGRKESDKKELTRWLIHAEREIETRVEISR
jgi:hypothetical protein